VTTSAVFFDAGETLVHPEPTFAHLMARVLQRAGHEVDAEGIRARSHVVLERFAHAAETKELWTTAPDRSRAFWHDVYAIFLRELGIADRDGLIDRLYAAFTDLANYALFDDVVPALERLREAGLRLGVISNYEPWLEQLLERLGVIGYFDVRVISGIEGIEKPDPAIFRLAMDRLGVEASASVYVGDDPRLDVGPAASVGMSPVLLDRRARFPDAPEPRIASMAEVPTLLGIAR
jgi:putative hydrolase of the HAD superfamily